MMMVSVFHRVTIIVVMMMVSVFYRLTIIVVMMMVPVFYRLTIIVCCNDDGFSVLQTDYNCLS